MFGRRGGGPVPRVTRLILGATATLVGALTLWAAIRISMGKLAGATDNPWPVYLFAAAMLGMGLMLFVGAVAGVSDKGEKPANMTLPTRLLIDAMGYAWGFGFAGFMAYWAMAPDTPFIARIGFGLFALLFGGASLTALIIAIRKGPRSR